MRSVTTVSHSDAVREYAIEVYMRPAIRQGERYFKVNVGIVHKALNFSNRVPLVCAALKSKRFLEENNLRLVSQTGPRSGQSTTVTFAYEILSPPAPAGSLSKGFMTLRGIAKDVFQKLGGGEAFIRNERSTFHDGLDK